MNIFSSDMQLSFGARIRDIPSMNIEKVAVPLKDLKLSGYTAMIGADVYTPSNKIAKHDLLFKDRKLIAVDYFESESIMNTIKYIFLKDKTVTPAILDEHIHGGYGISFHDSDEKSIRGLLKRLKKEGTAAIVATTLPGKLDYIKNQLKVLNNIIKNPEEDAAKVYGIHLEGPFINKEKIGIHPPEKTVLPTVENFQALEPENVKIVTLAPELDESFKLSHYLRDLGITVSAGHSMATAKQVLESKANQVTHLFNAMAKFHHREETIANEGLLNDNIAAEMNSEPALLEPRVMDLIMKTKPADKSILISDALPEAGIKEDFVMNGIKIHVDDNWIARSESGILAGSMRFLPQVMSELFNVTSLRFKDFIRFASVNPAKNLGVENEFKIEKGLEPNITIWDNETNKPEKTFI